MVEFVRSSDRFGVVQRSVRADGPWPGSGAGASRLAGPVVLDVYNELRAQGNDDLIGMIIAETTVAGVLLSGWDNDQINELRSSAWRSAHRFLVSNVESVDRGREIDELAQLLRVAR